MKLAIFAKILALRLFGCDTCPAPSRQRDNVAVMLELRLKRMAVLVLAGSLPVLSRCNPAGTGLNDKGCQT